MRISDDDIAKMLAELPEIELPDGFHHEVMQKVRQAAKPKAKKSRTMWYIGSFATAAAAIAAIMLTTTNLGQSHMDFAPVAEMAPFAVTVTDAEYDEEFAVEFGTGFAAEHDAPKPALAEPEAAIGRMEARPWSAADFLGQAGTTDVFHFPEHLPTDLIDFDLAEYFTFTFEITIAVHDMDYAGEAIYVMGAPHRDMARGATLQPAFEDLEAAFIALYNLGIVEEYRVTTTDILALNDAEQAADLRDGANTIFITLLQHEP